MKTLKFFSKSFRIVKLSLRINDGQRKVFSHGWLPCDFNDDGVLDNADSGIWAEKFESEGDLSQGDANGDGWVDIDDFDIFVDYEMGYGNEKVSHLNDLQVTYSRLSSYNLPDSPVSLCDIGHQGLMHDKEFGLIYNRARYLHPVLGRFTQRDPLGYVDGMNLYEYVGSSPVKWLDPFGRRRNIIRSSRTYREIPIAGIGVYIGLGGSIEGKVEIEKFDCCKNGRIIKQGWTEGKIKAAVHAGVGVGGEAKIFGVEVDLLWKGFGV